MGSSRCAAYPSQADQSKGSPLPRARCQKRELTWPRGQRLSLPRREPRSHRRPGCRSFQPSRCGPTYSAHAHNDDGQTRDLPASDAILSHVMWPWTPAGRRHLALRCRTCCLRANKNPRPLRYLIFRGSIPHPMQSLCTLRNHCHQWPRNTRYQADATPYLGRTSTGWIAPACGWRTYSITSSARASEVGGLPLLWSAWLG